MFRFGLKYACRGALTLAAVAALAWSVAAEMRTSWLQAHLFGRYVEQLTFALEPGPNPGLRFPTAGPYDERLGYVGLPSFAERLGANDFTITSQARMSPQLQAFIDNGGFAIYREKTQAGLSLSDRNGRAMFAPRFPGRVYESFKAIPPLIVETLLFVENRDLLDDRHPMRNPAVEWDRLGRVLLTASVHALDSDVKVPGASTLATQIEKFRHSPEGRTVSGKQKLHQMFSASIRAYRDGLDTSATRRRIVVDYLNATPLSARGDFGEVHGLGDGLWAWYGTGFEDANRVLHEAPRDAAGLRERARIYKQALSLLLAQRRPSYYLLAGRDALAALTDSHLRVLGNAGIIDAALRDAALRQELEFRGSHPPADTAFVDRKAINIVRTNLLSLLGARSFYDLDRLDLSADTTIDAVAQEQVTDTLLRINQPEYAAAAGLSGHRLLERGDTRQVAYSVTVYERDKHANLVRVQADNLDRPFDLNGGAKLDLGSTAKLRTLITYLDVIADLHARYASLPPEALKATAASASGTLAKWALLQLAGSPDRDLAALLKAAMARRYSASPHEGFFTGGGLHRFGNFDSRDDGQAMTVAEAFRKSVNLVFVRMMRDIVAHYMNEGDVRAGEMLADARHPVRQDYLRRFADREGMDFLNAFYDSYRGLDAESALNRIASSARSTHRLAVTFTSVLPEADIDEFADFLRSQAIGSELGDNEIGNLFEKYGAARFSLNDRGYLARIHPLELWLVSYLQQNPAASRADILAASVAERQEVYAWLFRTGRKHAQDKRIRTILEEEAFARIHAVWQRLGYPFARLVPSYATALGSSGDRPGALAELMGIIVNGGIRLPTAHVERLHFAAGTPYETELSLRTGSGKRVLAPEVAATVRAALIDVVEHGTAKRVHGAFLGSEGTALPTGGKTGTGDHRFERYASGGRLIESRVVNRTGTFVFFLGDCLFGTITAHVAGPAAAEYRFTSALPVQLLRILAPSIQPLVDSAEASPGCVGHDVLEKSAS